MNIMTMQLWVLVYFLQFQYSTPFYFISYNPQVMFIFVTKQTHCKWDHDKQIKIKMFYLWAGQDVEHKFSKVTKEIIIATRRGT